MSTVKITNNEIKPAVVASIEEGSIGEELGFEVGDQLISINGVKPRDLIDYKFLIAEENIQLTILDEKGQKHTIDVEGGRDDGTQANAQPSLDIKPKEEPQQLNEGDK